MRNKSSNIREINPVEMTRRRYSGPEHGTKKELRKKIIQKVWTGWGKEGRESRLVAS